MKTKSLLTAVLIVFVLASVVVLAMKEMNKPAPGDRASPQTMASPSSETSVIAYYFHSNVRCATCTSIESYAKEAVESGFPEPLKSGRLEWRIVNYEESGNEHFATDYDLAAPCVVLVAMRGDKQVEWRSLPEVWEHVGDKPKFIEFVTRNVKEFLDNLAQGAGAT